MARNYSSLAERIVKSGYAGPEHWTTLNGQEISFSPDARRGAPDVYTTIQKAMQIAAKSRRAAEKAKEAEIVYMPLARRPFRWFQ